MLVVIYLEELLNKSNAVLSLCNHIFQEDIKERVMELFANDYLKHTILGYSYNCHKHIPHYTILVNISSSTFLGHIALYGCPTD